MSRIFYGETKAIHNMISTFDINLKYGRKIKLLVKWEKNL